MRKDVKTAEELFAEIADLRRRVEESERLLQKANNNRVGRELAEEALKKAENGQKRAENALTQSESQVKNLTSQLLLAEEKERKRIANELHDSLGQSLNAISTSVRNALQQVGDKVKTGFESLEGIMPIIYPSIRVEKQTEIQETQVPDYLKSVIYRILQEAMNNIARHSKASLVRLSLKEKDDRIELGIEDNGIGFDMESIKKGLGLGSMRERAEFSGGSFDNESAGGKGTMIHASWPLILGSE